MFTSTVKATLSRIQNRHPPPKQPLRPPPLPPNTMIPDSSPGRSRPRSFWRLVLLTCDPPSEGVESQVEENCQGHAQDHADEQPEKAPSSHLLKAFRVVAHGVEAVFVSNTTSSKTASR